MSEAVGAKGPKTPRRCGQQRCRDKVLTEEPKEYYKRSIASPFGSFLTQLQERFSSDHQRIALGLSLVPKCFEGHSTGFRAHKEIGRTLQGWSTYHHHETLIWKCYVGERSGTTTRVRCRTSQPILFFSVTATLSNIATLCWGLFAPFLLPAAPVSRASLASSGWKHIRGQQW